jgi:hypothetical protein
MPSRRSLAHPPGFTNQRRLGANGHRNRFSTSAKAARDAIAMTEQTYKVQAGEVT